ncbi:MAG: hypothetical protein K9J27_08885 [Bacteroidales bacterium]|nr:hypothetical protein [Bacteroidales bacterium]MCF8333502.1 hypothetical protein [Bacteroidales bacterium]
MSAKMSPPGGEAFQRAGKCLHQVEKLSNDRENFPESWRNFLTSGKVSPPGGEAFPQPGKHPGEAGKGFRCVGKSAENVWK